MLYNAPEGKFNNSDECIKSLEEQRDKQRSFGEKIYDGEFDQTVAYALLNDTRNHTRAEEYLAEALQTCIADCRAHRKMIKHLNEELEKRENNVTRTNT